MRMGQGSWESLQMITRMEKRKREQAVQQYREAVKTSREEWRKK